jgi:hypothetical protein
LFSLKNKKEKKSKGTEKISTIKLRPVGEQYGNAVICYGDYGGTSPASGSRFLKVLRKRGLPDRLVESFSMGCLRGFFFVGRRKQDPF